MWQEKRAGSADFACIQQRTGYVLALVDMYLTHISNL
jgi:hypothetical protein